MIQAQKKYEFTGETKEEAGRTLHRIRRLSDRALGGWIESEKNLSHEGSCWVYGDAQVYGDARVYDDARVYGDAYVFGNAVATEPVEFFRLTRDAITVTDEHIAVGCELHLITYWLRRGFIRKIGEHNGYPDKDIRLYTQAIKFAATLRGIKK